MSAKKKLSRIISQLIFSDDTTPLSGISIAEQFKPEDNSPHAQARNLNAAFLIMMSGNNHPLYEQALEYISSQKSSSSMNTFYSSGPKAIHAEIKELCQKDNNFKELLDDTYTMLETTNEQQLAAQVRKIFCPEGALDFKNSSSEIQQLREKRMISITSLHKPVSNPAKEIIFTSNALITIPAETEPVDTLELDDNIKSNLKDVIQEKQKFWYDHPIQIGTVPEKNEVIYGLDNLQKAFEYEQAKDPSLKNQKLTCLLSVSVTHDGLHGISKAYLENELKEHGTIPDLDVYVFNESDTEKIISEIIAPASRHYFDNDQCKEIKEVFGVDGEYGRHYSFLKAITAFWQVFISPETKATFKIDLDQVFAQKVIEKETGKTVFDLLKTPLWGANGTDSNGRNIHLGMLAGALVNESDIDKSLFTPDVKLPQADPRGESLIFWSGLPQALSTEAEMMTRYSENNDLDGKKKCLQRIHVTGGTNGILIDSLKTYRPFTPTFVGRAEDQSYIMSTLFNEANDACLRYAHRDGLIMRHDKHAFAGEAIEAARIGKMVGDYIRILIFSYYAKALPWSDDAVKEELDPFTGCFISRLPLTVVYLRFALRAAQFFKEGNTEDGHEFIMSGAERIGKMIDHLSKGTNPLQKGYNREKTAWNRFYDILQQAETKLQQNDSFTVQLREKARVIIADCKLKV